LEKARNTPVEKRRQYKAATLSKPEVAAKNRATALRWARENPERVKENRRRACSQRRSLVREAPKVKFTASKLQERMSYFGGLCYLRLDGCTVIGTQVDHVKPLSKGGSDMLCNLRPACESCNKRKSNKWPLEGLL
jgi:5-methylcytosine-specific restriction endonuclease McrA